MYRLNYFRILMVSLLALAIVACSDDSDNPIRSRTRNCQRTCDSYQL